MTTSCRLLDDGENAGMWASFWLKLQPPRRRTMTWCFCAAASGSGAVQALPPAKIVVQGRRSGDTTPVTGTDAPAGMSAAGRGAAPTPVGVTPVVLRTRLKVSAPWEGCWAAVGVSEAVGDVSSDETICRKRDFTRG